MIKSFLIASAVLTMLPVAAHAETPGSWAGVGYGTADQVSLEATYAPVEYVSVRGSLNSQDLRVVPTYNVGLNDTTNAYVGAGLGYNFDDSSAAVVGRLGVESRFHDNVIGFTHVDYSRNNVDVTAGLGYSF